MANYVITPRFFKASKGDLFTLNVTPLDPPRGHVIYLPAHGEELNRCRTAVAAHAKTFAKSGIECTVVDYYGTGDSDGGFSQGNLSIWLNDLSELVSSIKSKNSYPIYLAGFRLGALLGLAYINDNPDAIHNTLLVQPVTQGKQYVTQLLRQRMAGQLGSGLPAESTDQMRQSLKNGNDIEIGGYEFGSELLNQLDSLSIAEFNNLSNHHFHWLEFEQGLGKGITIASQRMIKTLETNNNNVETLCANDPPIWQLHERAHAPHNIELVKKVAEKW